MEENVCPNCGRKLTESELYCYFCEFDISELKNKREMKRKKSSKR